MRPARRLNSRHPWPPGPEGVAPAAGGRRWSAPSRRQGRRARISPRRFAVAAAQRLGPGEDFLGCVLSRFRPHRLPGVGCRGPLAAGEVLNGGVGVTRVVEEVQIAGRTRLARVAPWREATTWAAVVSVS